MTDSIRPGCVIESGKRLSESLIWKLQRNFYDQKGVSAWNTGLVPHYITSNSYIAWSYARLIRGFLTDLERTGQIDPTEPVYVVELGAGAGRFSYHCLTHLLALNARRHLSAPVRYVMTDFTRANMGFWRDHERFQRHYQSGVLDLANFDAENPAELVCETSGVTLTAGSVRNPLIVVANYVFDTLVSDAFRIQGGQLLECLATLRSDEPAESGLDDPALLARLRVEYQHSPADAAYYPDHPHFNQILGTYRDTLGDTSVVFPTGALRCIDHLSAISNGRMLLIAADKAFNHLNELTWHSDPEPVVHGSFSLTANFDAIGRYVELLGGLAMHTRARQAGLQVASFALGFEKEVLDETRLEFTETMDGFGPVDFFTFREGLPPKLTLKQYVDLLALAQWDHRVFYELSESMYDQVESASEALKRQLRIAIARVWELYYPIGDHQDVAFVIGRFLHRLQQYREAIEAYEESRRIFSENTMTWFNVGMCHYNLRELDMAVRCLQESLAMDPANSYARNWLVRIKAEQTDNAIFSPHRPAR